MKNIISYEVKVSLYFVLLIIVTVAIFTNKEKLDKSYFSTNYKYYYVILFFNLLNLMIVTVFYNYKVNKIQGIRGKQGIQGNKGERGGKITCSYCEHHLNIKKTKNYREIVKMNIGDEKNLNNDGIKKVEEQITNFGVSGMGVDMEYFDLSFLNSISEANKSSISKNKELKLLKSIFNFETRMKFLLNYMNKLISKNKQSSNISFFRPTGVNSYFPIGHSVFSSELATKMNAFLINGDVRFPPEYDIKFTFLNEENLGRQGEELEKIVKMRYSVLSVKDFKDNQDTFVPMSELIVRNETNTSGKYATNLNLMACINIKCAELVSLDDLDLIGIKMSFNTDSDSKLNVNKIISLGLEDQLNIYSIWKTPMNTFVTNSVINNNLLFNRNSPDRTRTSNIYVLLGKIILDNDERFITKNNINQKGKEYIKKYLSAIKLPKILRVCYIMRHQYNEYFNELKYYLTNMVGDLNVVEEELKKSNTKKLISDKQKQGNLKNLAEIKKKTTIFQNIIKNINYKNNNEVFENLEDFFLKETQTLLKDNVPKYKKLTSKLQNIPLLIDSNVNLYEILLLLFPLGLETIINLNKNTIKLSIVQLEILKICKICFPPNLKIYMPKKSCISYDKVDLERRKLIRTFDNVFTEYNFLLKLYELNKSDDESKYCNNIKAIKKKRIILYNNLDSNFNHIEKYLELIESQDMELFSNGRLKFIIKQYQTVINEIKNNCKKD
jgi:hypothetical protein